MTLSGRHQLELFVSPGVCHDLLIDSSRSCQHRHRQQLIEGRVEAAVEASAARADLAIGFVDERLELAIQGHHTIGV